MLLCICTLCMLLFSVYAVVCRSLLRSAIALAFTSAMLSVIFYLLQAPMASVFELSVCCGMVTVIFIASISLVRATKAEIQKEYQDKERNRYLPLFLIGIGILLMVLAGTIDFAPLEIRPVFQKGNLLDVFWNRRQVDIWGQIAAILCGGVAVAVLFREERRDS